MNNNDVKARDDLSTPNVLLTMLTVEVTLKGEMDLY